MNMRVCAEIDLDAIKHNFGLCKDKSKKVMCIIKADAYGHGSIQVARALNAADYFGVATPDEAIELRCASIKTPILLLGFCPIDIIDKLILANITISVYNMEIARKISKVATYLRKTAKVHIKINTGLNRLGFNDIADILEVYKLENLYIEGVYTHLAISKTENITDKKKIFDNILDNIRENNHNIDLVHIANSEAIFNMDNSDYDIVRPGICLYGYPASNGFIPAMTLKCSIANISKLPAGSPIGYGETHILSKDSKVATLTIGYADGLNRGASNTINILINNTPCPLIGNICMDMCMVDVSHLSDISLNDEAIIFGKDYPADILADKLSTITHEVLCNISRRVPRIYK